VGNLVKPGDEAVEVDGSGSSKMLETGLDDGITIPS
jgi:hypothetical protein